MLWTIARRVVMPCSKEHFHENVLYQSSYDGQQCPVSEALPSQLLSSTVNQTGQGVVRLLLVSFVIC